MRRKMNLLLTACAALTLGMGAIAFSACGEEPDVGGVKPHDHVWDPDYTITKQATCTEEGERFQHCLVKGCDATTTPEKIPMTPHQFLPEKDTATCGVPGNRVQECKVCGYQKVGEATPALEHNYVQDTVTKQPTCTEEGRGTEKCTRCGDVKTDVPIPMNMHRWAKNPKKSYAATCEDNGYEWFDCLNEGCGDHMDNVIEATGHKPDPDTYEYKYPTFSEAGYRKGTCTVCKKTLDDTMPKLEDGAKTEFQFKVVRTTGKILTTYAMKITITDWEGKEVATAESKDLRRGVYYVELPVHQGKKYTMSVSGLTGYKEGAPVEVDPELPVGEIKATANGLFEKDAQNVPTLLGQGNMAQDFELKDIEGNTIHLKDYVKNNKLVLLHFFYTTCHWCNTEFPGYIKAVNEYKDKGVASIGIAPTCWYNNSISELKQEVKQLNIKFPVICDEGVNGYLNYRYSGVNGAPSTVFIDHEGVIVKIQSGYLTTDYNTDDRGIYTDVAYKQLFEEFTDFEWDDMKGQSVAPVEDCECILPKREEF